MAGNSTGSTDTVGSRHWQYQAPLETAIPEAPVTVARRTYNPNKFQNARLPDAGTPRTNIAETVHSPAGTPVWSRQHSHHTVLQQHCDFFDHDGDGVIWPGDTLRSLRALGFGFVLSATATIVTHALFSYATCPSLLPDPFFRVFVGNIHKAKHGSDSGVYDNEGRFVPQKFEDWFCKYGRGKDGLTKKDILTGLSGQRVLMDPVGWFATAFAWLLTYLLLWPDDGILKKEDIRCVYDGSIFQDIAAKVSYRANACR